MAVALRRAGWGRPRGTSRAGVLAAAALTLVSCYHPPPLAMGRAVDLWRRGELAAPGPGPGAPPAAAAVASLTMEAAVARALARHPGLRALRARVAVARARAAEVGQLDNPELRVGSEADVDAGEARADLRVAMRVPLPRPGADAARVRAAELEADVSAAEVAVAEREVAAEVRRRFVELAALRAEEAVVADGVAALLRHHERVAERVAAAAATKLDLALADLPRAEAADELARLGATREDVARQLRAMLSLAPDAPTRFEADLAVLSVPDPGRDRGALVTRALTGRAEVRAAAAEVARAEASAHAARALRWPWLRFAQLDYGYRPPQLSRADQHSLGVQLAVELPLLNSHAGSVSAADAQVRRRREEERAVAAGIVAEVDAALARVRAAEARAREVEATLLPAMAAASEVLAEALARGAVDPLRAAVLEERRSKARRRHIAASRAVLDALITLAAAAGAQETPWSPPSSP